MEDHNKFDIEAIKSCGSTIDYTNIIIFNPDKDGNGEVCYKGRNRFMGYFKNEDATRKTIY